MARWYLPHEHGQYMCVISTYKSFRFQLFEVAFRRNINGIVYFSFQRRKVKLLHRDLVITLAKIEY